MCVFYVEYLNINIQKSTQRECSKWSVCPGIRKYQELLHLVSKIFLRHFKTSQCSSWHFLRHRAFLCLANRDCYPATFDVATILTIELPFDRSCIDYFYAPFLFPIFSIFLFFTVSEFFAFSALQSLREEKMRNFLRRFHFVFAIRGDEIARLILKNIYTYVYIYFSRIYIHIYICVCGMRARACVCIRASLLLAIFRV